MLGVVVGAIVLRGALPDIRITGMPHTTTQGRTKVRGEKAFVLAVELRFRDAASAQSLVNDWQKAADYCLEHEPFLFHYEVARSDKDPVLLI